MPRHLRGQTSPGSRLGLAAADLVWVGLSVRAAPSACLGSSGKLRFCNRTHACGPGPDLEGPPGCGSYCPVGVPCSRVTPGCIDLPARVHPRGLMGQLRASGHHAQAWLPLATVLGALPGGLSSREGTALSLQAQWTLRGQASPLAFTLAQVLCKTRFSDRTTDGSSRVALPPLEDDLVCARLLDTSVTLQETQMTVRAVRRAAASPSTLSLCKYY